LNKEYKKYIQSALSRRKENKRIVDRLKKMKPTLLNTLINNMHAEAFEIIDCLKCANCCSSISPVVTDNDISKISKHLRKKPNKVVQEYMLLDNDKDYVMNRTPCPFLMPDNCCNIYDSRPLACKGYPHTDHNKMHQILQLTLRNTEVCPAVCYIFERLSSVK
jgi:uncharacterized protein